MAKTRSRLASWLSNLGDRLFSLLSGFEERGVFPGAVRYIKLCVLGAVIGAITTLLPQEDYPMDTCYIYVPTPYFEFFDVSVEPNPTEGADTVTIKATLDLLDADYDEYIAGAACIIAGDTIELEPVDSVFDGLIEEITGRISVEELEPDTYWVYISAITSMEWWEEHVARLVVSKPGSKGK
ncbi:hypothetical protein JXM67_12715 [candidate division WOR-3 bacterium]|nr:hypothetical protein [candidate division WOR-3 bacterium]